MLTSLPLLLLLQVFLYQAPDGAENSSCLQAQQCQQQQQQQQQQRATLPWMVQDPGEAPLCAPAHALVMLIMHMHDRALYSSSMLVLLLMYTFSDAAV
jgi:hypothetical protein